ncbi:MAG: hypothetical protein C4538_02505 [Nitrospiraceae bacterium]|nr:MAG: hypothetical protein C4538_02505 [Nitrospiraceae bacterium]
MKNHFSVTYLLLAVFVIYAISPLSYTLTGHQELNSLQSRTERHLKNFQLFFVDVLLNKLFSKTENSSEAPRISFLIKKKRAIIKNTYFKIKLKLLKQPMTSYTFIALQMLIFASFCLFVFPGPSKTFEGLFLFSGISPPFSR